MHHFIGVNTIYKMVHLTSLKEVFLPRKVQPSIEREKETQKDEPQIEDSEEQKALRREQARERYET